MSIAQLKRRINTLQSRRALANPRCFTYEELHRMAWRQHRRAYLELARGGNRDAQLFKKQFEDEEAAKAQQALQRKNRGSIR